MSLTIPFTNISLSPLHLFFLTLLCLFVIAVIQASIAVIRYRRNFGDAPLPIIPSHGVVVAKGASSVTKLPDESLRLLLVGDSLACGVGQSVRCTPVMPEVISRELSRATGKAVFWTCHGESGASAGWIIRTLERGMNAENEAEVEYGACNCDDTHVDGEVTDQNEIMMWRERLQDYRQRFDPNELGPYDFVIVLTGTNDLKIMLFPYLITEEDRELRNRRRSAGLTEDLQALIQTISDRMKRGMQNISERAGRMSRRIRGNTEEFESLVDIDSRKSPKTVPELSDMTFPDATLSDDEERTRWNGRSCPTRTPLFVLPAMPIRSSPSIRKIPLRWLTIPVFDRMEAKKRKLAAVNPDILWVDDPSLETVIEYGEHQGALWEQHRQAEILLSLRCIRGGECSEITEAMRHYYAKEIHSNGAVNDTSTLRCLPVRPPKPDGTKLFCGDRIHPNEAGYECWGLHIANAIVADMKTRNTKPC